jgi:hypothetical protein
MRLTCYVFLSLGIGVELTSLELVEWIFVVNIYGTYDNRVDL